MKGNLVSLSAALVLKVLMGSATVFAQEVVINELNLVVGPEVGQFVEPLELSDRVAMPVG